MGMFIELIKQAVEEVEKNPQKYKHGPTLLSINGMDSLDDELNAKHYATRKEGIVIQKHDDAGNQINQEYIDIDKNFVEIAGLLPAGTKISFLHVGEGKVYEATLLTDLNVCVAEPMNSFHITNKELIE